MNIMDFNTWVRKVINTQADNSKCNSVSIDDFSRDGMKEFLYPKYFYIDGDEYLWTITRKPTRGKSCATHYILLFGGKCFSHNNCQVATGELTKGKIRKGLKIIYDYYNNETINQNK
jgi:hypothetical protein